MNEYNLDDYKTKNKFGLQRKYKLTSKQLNTFRERHTWIEILKDKSYIFRDYKTMYIVISKFKDKFTVTANGCKINSYPNKYLTSESYETLDEAKDAAIQFADIMVK